MEMELKKALAKRSLRVLLKDRRIFDFRLPIADWSSVFDPGFSGWLE